MIGRWHMLGKRLLRVGMPAFGFLAVTASAQMSDSDKLANCDTNRQAIAMLEAQRANGGRLDTSMARAELDRMKAHLVRVQKIEALRAAGNLLGRVDLDADRELEAEKSAIAASARKYSVGCSGIYSDGFAEQCIASFEAMIRQAATTTPDPKAVDAALAAYRSNIAAMDCDRLAAAADRAAASQAQASAPGCHGFTGKWTTNYGPMWLVVNGSSITGFYDWVGSAGPRHDTLSGTVTGNIAEGTYSQPGYPNPDYQSGRFKFELNGNSFSGTGWSRSGNGALGWSGTCASR